MNIEFANFSTMFEQFADHESICNRYDMPPRVGGPSMVPLLQLYIH